MAYNKDEKQTPRRIKAEHKMMAVTEETQSIPQKKTQGNKTTGWNIQRNSIITVNLS